MKNLLVIFCVTCFALAADVRSPLGLAPAVGAATTILTDGQIDIGVVRTIRSSLQGPERSMLLSRFGEAQVAWLDQLAEQIESEAEAMRLMVESARIQNAAAGRAFQLTTREKDWFEQLLPYYNARRRMLWRGFETVEEQIAAGRAAVEARVQLIRKPMDSHFEKQFTAKEIETLQTKGLCLTRAKAATFPVYTPKPVRERPSSLAVTQPPQTSNGL